MRILFSGDEVARGVMLYWQQPEPQPTVEQHSLNLEKLLKHRDEFDHICSGHGEGLEPASLLENCLEHDRLIMSGVEGEPMVMKAHSGGPDPRDFQMYQIEFKRSSTYKELFLGYDCRYIYNKKG